MNYIAIIVILALAAFFGFVARNIAYQVGGIDTTEARRNRAAASGLNGRIGTLGDSRLAKMPIDRETLRRTELQIARAGLDMSVGTYWALSIVGAIVGGLVGVVLATALSPWLTGASTGVFLRIVVIAACVACGAVAPKAYVGAHVRRRRELIEATMSYTLDLLSVVVNSGQTIEQGIKTVAEKSDGPLADEFAIASRQINVLGAPPARALQDMAERVDIPALSLFCSSVMQALASGSPLADELKIQAEEAADRYYQMVDERASKVSNKMVFPLALMMLPAIMILVLVPMVLRLAEQMPGFLPGLA